MSSVCFYFQVHQPFRLRRYDIFDIGKNRDYFADVSDSPRNNERVFKKVARKSYLPTNKILQTLLDTYPEFAVSFSFSGTVLDQMRRFAPEVLASFQDLAKNDRVEILAETYYHSLAFFYSRDEFEKQVAQHEARIKELFGTVPTVFRNTELAYNNEIAAWAADAGYAGILAEGWDSHLEWRSPNFVYTPNIPADIKLLLKNYTLSDDIAFRFSQEEWEEWPLNAETFGRWISEHNGNGNVINLFMDYETFGEHQWETTGIFDFLTHLPEAVLKHPDNSFVTPSEAIHTYDVQDTIDVPNTTTWADTQRDLSAWLGNDMQKQAIDMLYNLEPAVHETTDEAVLEDWRLLQTSDHFYYMCTKWSDDGDVHAYFNPYASPYEAHISYMNVLQDLRSRINAPKQTNQQTEINQTSV